MISYDEWHKQLQQPRQASITDSVFSFIPTNTPSARKLEGAEVAAQNGIPQLTLYNPTLDIRMVGVNGAVIGRRQGPYQQFFEGNMYISGVHAQLIYKSDSGWCIIDKHSSNGTKLNQRDLQPDVPMTLKAGDIVTLANINLQVSIS
jgi:hypothetical protein